MTTIAIIFVYLAYYVAQIVGHDLTKCHWIWTNDQAATGDVRTFQRVFHPQDGNVPVSAEVLIASGQHDLFVNNNRVSGDSGRSIRSDGSIAHVHTVHMDPGSTIFSIKTQGGYDHEAGLLSSITIKFKDGSHHELHSDSEWLAAYGPFADATPRWERASVLGAYGSQPWGTIIVVPVPSVVDYGYGHGGHEHYNHHHHDHHTHTQRTSKSTLSSSMTTSISVIPSSISTSISTPISAIPTSTSNTSTSVVGSPTTTAAPAPSAILIWTDETVSGTWKGKIVDNMAPKGHRAFRKTVTVNNSTTITAVNVTMGVDNGFGLYIQGAAVGTGAGLGAHYFYANLTKPVAGPGTIVIAVDGENNDSPSGPASFGGIFTLLGTGPGGTGPQAVVLTDSTWKAARSLPSGFQQPNFNDTSFTPVTVHGVYTPATGPGTIKTVNV